MLNKSAIDMSRPYLLYSGGVVLLMILGLVGANVPELAISQYFDFPERRYVSAGLFLGGAFLGVLAFLRQAARVTAPWRVPQSQVLAAYLSFFSLTMLAIGLAR